MRLRAYTMAIIQDLPGVDVSIMVDGKPLKEYKESADTSAGNEEVHYVQSVTGQTFSIQCKIQKGTKIKGDALTFDVYADGVLIDRPFVQSRYFAYSDAIRPIEGHIVQGGKVQRLRFSNLRKGKVFRIKMLILANSA